MPCHHKALNVVVVAAKWRPTSFCHISHIVGMCSQDKMIRVNADTVVASMPDDLAFRYFTFEPFKKQPTNPAIFPGYFCDRVAIGVWLVRCAVPAVAGDLVGYFSHGGINFLKSLPAMVLLQNRLSKSAFLPGSC
jgi:hypothetical protein